MKRTITFLSLIMEYCRHSLALLIGFHSSCPSFAAHRAACLAGVSPAAGIDCMPA